MLMHDSGGLRKGALYLCLLSLAEQMQTSRYLRSDLRGANRGLLLFPTQRDQAHDCALQGEHCVVFHHYQGGDD